MSLVKKFRQEVTDQIIACLEQGNLPPWVETWSKKFYFPFNPLTKRHYQGGNIIRLTLAQRLLYSSDPRWMTFRQASKAGFRIRKGAKAAPILVVIEKPPKKEEKDEALDDDEAKEDKKDRQPELTCKLALLFNGEDIIGLPKLKKPENLWTPVELAERLVKASGAKIIHQTYFDSPYFSSTDNHILVPEKGLFSEAENYYSVLLHELVHWAGGPSQMGRIPKRKVSEEEYALEELIAEIGSCQLKAMMGININYEKSTDYISGYLDCLKRDPNQIFIAAHEAEKAVNYLLDMAPDVRAQINAVYEINYIESVDDELRSGEDAHRPSPVGLALTKALATIRELEALEEGRPVDGLDEMKAHLKTLIMEGSVQFDAQSSEAIEKALYLYYLQHQGLTALPTMKQDIDDICQDIMHLGQASHDEPSLSELCEGVRHDYYDAMASVMLEKDKSLSSLVTAGVQAVTDKDNRVIVDSRYVDNMMSKHPSVSRLFDGLEDLLNDEAEVVEP